MTQPGLFVADLGIIALLIVGISRFRSPRGARQGNLIEALALALAAAVVMTRYPITGISFILPAVLIGGTVGWLVAARVSMVQIPAMVAFQHGMGGIAATFVSLVELSRRAGEAPPINAASAVLGLIVGAATFSGSMVAAGKLSGRLKQTPVVLPHHDLILAALVLAVAALASLPSAVGGALAYRAMLVLTGAAMALGIVFSVRIGGADMPVLISFLNATAGLAAALCGLTIQNRLLIACGATVAASGSILTHVMCRAMNRSLLSIITGTLVTAPPGRDAAMESSAADAAPPPVPADSPAETAADATAAPPLARAIGALKDARSVIVIPGYGMALAQAQFEVVQLARKLEEAGKQVRFAIHPVAGRMPGHMHVLLAEAEVDYDKLFEIDRINPEFRETDAVLIVGACDVVNPAAINVPGTPISGMPILMAHEAKQIIVCNLDERPGYSGVENPLYRDPRTIFLAGDAKGNVQALLDGLA